MIWNDVGIFWWDGGNFISEDLECTSQVILQNSNLAYRIFYVGCDYEITGIEVRRDGDWIREDIHFPEDIVGYAVAARIDAFHTAFSYTHGVDYSNVVLREDGTEVVQSWPSLWWMDFAEGGGGLGSSSVSHEVYRIAGTQTEFLFKYEPATSYPYCILAADAE